MGMGFNKSKFVFSETFNNADGKTSGSGFIGVILGLVGALSFLAAMGGYFYNLPNTLEVMNSVVQLILIAAALMGARKLTGAIGNGKNETLPPPPPPPSNPTDEKG
jgi:hypothetical protein